MNTLIEYSARLVFAFEYRHAFNARVVSGDGCRKPGGTSADNHHIVIFHFVTPERISEPLPFLVISSMEIPVSLAIISATDG